MLDEQAPYVRGEVLYEDKDITSEEFREKLWAEWDDRQNQMEILRRDYAPVQHDYSDDYNQVNLMWNPRTVTGMDNNPRMKEMFVELEYMIEENFGRKRLIT